MQKLRAITVLLFVSITMILGACATDETLNEVETSIEMKYDGDEDGNGTGGMGTEDEDSNGTGGMGTTNEDENETGGM